MGAPTCANETEIVFKFDNNEKIENFQNLSHQPVAFTCITSMANYIQPEELICSRSDAKQTIDPKCDLLLKS